MWIRPTSPLPPPPYIRQAASTLTPSTAPNHDNINTIANNIGGMAMTCHYCDANCGPQKHPHYAVPMVKLIYLPNKLYQNLYTSCSRGILQNLDVFKLAFKVTIQLSHSHHLV